MTGAQARILRFALVGAGVAALYVLLYLVFLAAGLPQIVSNALAFLLAVIVQYFGQASYTFRAPLAEPRQILRFGFMIGAGLITSAIITGIIGPAIGLPHWAAAASVTVLLPIQNYIIISRWVFTRQADHVEASQ